MFGLMKFSFFAIFAQVFFIQPFSVDSTACYLCSSIANPDCKLNPEKTNGIRDCSFQGIRKREDDRCYTIESEGNVKRGCVAGVDFNEEDYQLCQQGSENCQLCEGDRCNGNDASNEENAAVMNKISLVSILSIILVTIATVKI